MAIIAADIRRRGGGKGRKEGRSSKGRKLTAEEQSLLLGKKKPRPFYFLPVG